MSFGVVVPVTSLGSIETYQVVQFHGFANGRQRPFKKFHELYEWVEDTVKAEGFVRISEVREKAAILVDSKFSKYKKFEKLGERIKNFLELKSDGPKGKQGKWIPK